MGTEDEAVASFRFDAQRTLVCFLLLTMMVCGKRHHKRLRVHKQLCLNQTVSRRNTAMCCATCSFTQFNLSPGATPNEADPSQPDFSRLAWRPKWPFAYPINLLVIAVVLKLPPFPKLHGRLSPDIPSFSTHLPPIHRVVNI